MDIPHSIQQFSFGDAHISLCVPDQDVIKHTYTSEKEKGMNPAFPYWAKLWPSSVALARYIHARHEIFKDKTVLELAAGLGLPSLVAARYSPRIISSDYVEEPLVCIRRSAAVNNYNNLSCRLINWQQFPEGLQPDIVLMSDINYDPQQFEILNSLLNRLLNKGTLLFLSTPQRIMGRPFIERLLPYCTGKQTSHVEIAGESAEIFIMQLEKRG